MCACVREKVGFCPDMCAEVDQISDCLVYVVFVSDVYVCSAKR